MSVTYSAELHIDHGRELVILGTSSCWNTPLKVAEAWELDTPNPLVCVYVNPIGVNGLKEIARLVTEHMEKE
jgi:hypothetical protein